jgi:heptaprenyl diphosphate synthase
LPFASLVAPQLEYVEELLQQLVPHDVPILSEIHRRITAGGKRLRPTLLLLSASVFRSLGPEDKSIYRAAAAVEAVHIASLLHDDLVDGATLRRGEQSVQQQYGLGPALLAGDYLAAAAYQRLCLQAPYRSLSLLSSAVAAMCEAEFTILSSTHIDLRTYIASAAGKTGALISAACEIGAIEAGADEKPAQILGGYGRNLGIAFQVTDDILDIFGSSSRSGKPVGQDIVTGQPNLVVLLALEADDGALREKLADLRGSHTCKAEAIREAIGYIRRLGVEERARAVAADYAERARDFLTYLPPTPARDALEAATQYVLRRDR